MHYGNIWDAHQVHDVYQLKQRLTKVWWDKVSSMMQ